VDALCLPFLILNPASCHWVLVQVQVIGMISWFRGKGMPGPFLIAAHPSQLPTWAQELQAMLGQHGLVVHVLDGQPGSRDVMQHVCRSAQASALSTTGLKGGAPNHLPTAG
jgi:hypothetical protein